MIPRLETTHWILLAVAAAAAALFSGLGLWQLERHAGREARNDTLRARLEAPAVDAAGVRIAGDTLAWRRVRLTGRYDYDREIVLRGRAHAGTPGVYVVTPLLRDDRRAVLVVRGWLPAADGVHAPLARGRPSTAPDSAVAVSGVLLPSVTEARAALARDTIEGGSHLVASHVDVSALADSLPYPVADLYAQRVAAAEGAYDRAEREQSAGGENGGELPAAIAAPSPDPGPHLWYALQWFGFAAIAVAGTGAYLYRDLRREPDPGPEGRAVDPGRAGPEPEV